MSNKLRSSPHNNKVVLIGEKSVGKSSLVFRLCKGQFKSTSESTIGAAFVSHKFQHPDREVILNIWDTAGQDRFNTFLPLYLREVDVALVCFEFPEKIQKYVSIVRNVDPDLHIILVATKIDLHASQYHEVEDYAEQEALKLFYTSSLSGQGVLDLFTNVAETIMDREENYDEEFIGSQSHCCYH